LKFGIIEMQREQNMPRLDLKCTFLEFFLASFSDIFLVIVVLIHISLSQDCSLVSIQRV
jgi:hypothetical protein